MLGFYDIHNRSLKEPEMKIVGFANGVGLDEVANNEPPHLDLHCLPSSLNSQHDIAWTTFFLNFRDKKFVTCFLVVKELTSIQFEVSLLYYYP